MRLSVLQLPGIFSSGEFQSGIQGQEVLGVKTLQLGSIHATASVAECIMPQGRTILLRIVLSQHSLP
jgi:hypothetical protein